MSSTEKEDAMTLKIEPYTRKSFEIQAVQVTEENLEEVAKWCKGEIVTPADAKKNRYIKAPVRRPLHLRQTQAFVGDWVLLFNTNFKVYTDLAFRENFYPARKNEVGTDTPREAEALEGALES